MFMDQIDPAMSWEDIAWLKTFTKLPVVLKGVQNGEDALRAAKLGTHIWVTSKQYPKIIIQCCYFSG